MRSALVTALVPLALLLGPGCEESSLDLGLQPAAQPEAGSSYALTRDTARPSARHQAAQRLDQFIHAFAYGDFDGDGTTDGLFAPGNLSPDPVPLIFIRDLDGAATPDPSFLGTPTPGTVHARNLLPGDFNGDGRLDAIVLDHGFDQPPFPGAPLLILMSTPEGLRQVDAGADEVGFHHGGASGDIDHDGDLDVFVGGMAPFFLLNDGTGTFTLDRQRVPPLTKVFTAELFDLDGDGFLDLVTGAHEHEGDPSVVWWGSSLGVYGPERFVIPEVARFGTFLDVDAEDLDGDGDRDLLVNRTGGGDANTYQGRRFQLLRNEGGRTFTDVSGASFDEVGSDERGWFDFTFVADLDADGDLDLFMDDWGTVERWTNDGAGRFTRASDLPR